MSGDPKRPWAGTLDPVTPLAVLDLRIDYLAPDSLGSEGRGPDGVGLASLPVAGGRCIGAGGLAGHIVPGSARLRRGWAEGTLVESLVCALAVDDGSTILLELRGLAGTAAARGTLRCTVNRGPHDWLGGSLLVTSSHVQAGTDPGSNGVVAHEFLRVFAAEGALPAGVSPGYRAMPELGDQAALRTEHVFDLVVTCASPQGMGSNAEATDGLRTEAWPITGGRFFSADGAFSGVVLPGGADYPVTRPDGNEWIDALYRLRTSDGETLVIHNKGFYRDGRCRLHPEFTVGRGRYDWLQRSIFLATLVEPVPASLACARDESENDRLIQVHRVL